MMPCIENRRIIKKTKVIPFGLV